MAKIHTHYDNLKVSRRAPPEVIRAAYKALSQKYHPDKNPGDEKAARIMAILNSAYGTLADPVRRREHDEWIAAEEWEIEWLESTSAEEERGLLRHEPQPDSAPTGAEPAPRASRGAAWWAMLGLCLAIGCAGGILLMSQTKRLPAAVSGALGTRPVVAAPPPAAEPGDRPLDTWATSRAEPETGAQAPQVKASAITELVIPARRPDCDTELHSLTAPNGEPWPAGSGYLAGFPVENKGDGMQIALDNLGNSSSVLVRILDLERHATVRHLFVLARERFTVEKLAAGRYQVQYQNIEVGGTGADCLARPGRVPDTVVQAD